MIIPIIDYGLRSRESSLKVNASQIVGTISHLIKDPKVLYKSRNSQGNESVFNTIYEETLASVYILKHDEYEVIKNTADNVWKENVSNTPKILKQILPTLVKKLIELMTFESGIQKLAHNTVKEYCGKYSDSVFYDFLDILEKRSKDEDSNLIVIYLSKNFSDFEGFFIEFLSDFFH